MTAPRFVIIGDGAAGLTAAQKLREKSPLSSITLLSDDPHPAYFRAALTNYLLGELADTQVWAVTPSFFYDYRLERLLTRVNRVDSARRQLYLANGAMLPYDALLLASGAHARGPSFEGAQLGGVWTFRTLHDARGMLDAIGRGMVQQAVIVGGGPLAIEWAMALHERKVRTTMLVRGQRVMEREIDATGSDLVVARLKLAGVDVRTQTEVHGAMPGHDGRVAAVVTRQGEQIPCQLVGCAIGAIPNTYFLEGSGVAVGKRGGIVVDDRMHTNVPGIFAAGDVVELGGQLLQLWEPARRQALVAADNMTGGETRYVTGAHYFATRLADLDFASVGAVFTEAGMEEKIERSQKTGTMAYRKLLFREGKLVGALMLGQRSEGVRRAGRAFKRLIDEQIDVSAIKGSLLDAKFDLNSWLRGRALVTRPKPKAAPAKAVAAGQIRGTQFVQMPGAVQAAAQAAGGVAVANKGDSPKLTIGLPSALGALHGRAVDQVLAHLEAGGKRWPLDRQVVTVGRDASCQVPIDDAWASGVHAEISLHNGQHFLRDMGSEGGTWINGSMATVAQRLAHGDRIHLGQTTLTYLQVGKGEAAMPAAPRGGQVPMLEVRRGPNVGLRFALDRDTITVGRDAKSQLRLEDVQVSRRHAVIARRAGGWYISDLHSTRGSYKNGAHLRPGEEVPLAVGDSLQLGDSYLTLILA
ncbi:MAG: FAD-dependent oxidoreductase [Polyangiaceae bacterium]